MKLFALPLLALLVACSAEEEPQDWIDVPLEPHTYFENTDGFSSEVINIYVAAFTSLEYKLGMSTGQSISYGWKLLEEIDPTQLLVEFHGHTIREGEAPGDVMFYRQANAVMGAGTLVAPFDGIHGWYFANESDVDITIQLTVSGAYQLQ